MLTILGLRPLFVCIYLRSGLAVLLVFIGVKMLLAEVFHIPIHWALAVVVGGLLLSVLVSLIYPLPEASVPATDDFPWEA